MVKRKLILGSIACLSIGMLVGRTLSQTRGGFGAGGGFGRSGGSGGVHRSSRSKVTEESKEASLKGAVGASEEQWTVIKPKLEKVRQLQRITCIGIMTSGGSSGGGSSRSQSRKGTATGPGVRGGATTETKPQSRSWMRWQWYKSWGSKPPQSEDEKLCDSLFRLLKNRNANPEEIRQKMDALSKSREQSKQELVKARHELRELLTLDQEARLVALGWLD
ncbi:MAG: hypothetical protein U9Q07_04690 [Planctomycetota bacterium]|nr:hypothetical protein [Planctomycetota bacterium]